MSKLRPDIQGRRSLHQLDLANLIHDQVVSLCHLKFNGVKLLEIDGLICISLPETREQQVVKIHTTIPSKKPSKCASTQTFESENVHKQSESNPHMLSNCLSELLKSTSTNQTPTVPDSEERQNRRKRKPPQHWTGNQTDVGQDNAKKVKESENNEKQTRLLPNPNPFLHGKDLERHVFSVVDTMCKENYNSDNQAQSETVPKSSAITIKEEPVDPEYGEIVPKIVNVQSISNEVKETSDTVEGDKDPVDLNSEPNESKKTEKVSSIINRLIEKGFYEKAKSADQYDDLTGQVAEPQENDNEIVTVKTEVSDDGFEPGGTSSNCDTADEADNTGSNTCSNEEQQLKDTEQFAALFGLYKANEQKDFDSANEGLDNSQSRRPDREDILRGKSWIDMVKDNVNKYQAALIRTGKITNFSSNETSGGKVAMVLPTSSPDATRQQTNSRILELLQSRQTDPNKPDVLNTSKKLENSRELRNLLSGGLLGAMESKKSERSSSVPRTVGRNSNSDRSSSCSPVVKIEVDEVDNTDLLKRADIATKSSDKQGGKLESLYPALFNQLQEPPKERVQGLEGESLVNRLPFISFQEIFSAAGSGGPLPRMSESTTMELLEKARLNPQQQKVKSKSKTVWNWKKRFVHPKTDKLRSAAAAAEAKSDSDQEWVPSESGREGSEDGGYKRRTRLSRGKTTRINFAEIDKSDSELEELGYYENQDEPPMELVSAYCIYNCGARFDSVAELEAHEERCKHSRGSPLDSGGSEAVNSGLGTSISNTNKEQYQCELCGLEFNQEYRKVYHMIKVHQISADQLNLSTSVFKPYSETN